MAMRQCPQCMSKLPPALVTAFTNGMSCPKCSARLEVALASRYVATAIGLAAGLGVWWLTHESPSALGWATGVLYGFLTFSIVSPILLAALADLRIAPEEPVPSAVAPSYSPSSHH